MIDDNKINEPLVQTAPVAVVKTGKGLFDVLPAKTAFFSGLVIGVMAFATVGFVLMLVSGADFSKFRFGGNGASGWGKPGTPVAVGNTNVNTPTAPVADLSKMPPIDLKADHIRGDLSKAKIALVEYSDYECPFCKQFHPTLQDVVKKYGSDVAWIYRYFPLSFHQNAEKEAEAAECVAQLGGNTAFWNFSDKIYERTTSNGTGFALTALGPLAKEVGVDQKKFQACLDSGKNAQLVAAEQAGGEAAGIDGTPGTIVLTKKGQSDEITGAQSLTTVEAKIDALLKS